MQELRTGLNSGPVLLQFWFSLAEPAACPPPLCFSPGSVQPFCQRLYLLFAPPDTLWFGSVFLWTLDLLVDQMGTTSQQLKENQSDLSELCIHEFDEAATSRSLKQEVGQRHEVHCSRERSRAAWKAIEEYLIPFVDEEQYDLPKKCRLNPENDMFRDQEQHKVHVDTNEWRCGFCRKSFRAEKFLDQHFDNRHYNQLNDSQGRCLADLCGALHCDFVIDSKKTKTKCNPAAAARNRHLCESLADTCFPLNKGQSASRLHEFFLHQFCDAHTCAGGKKPFARGGKKESSVFYLAVCILVVMLLPLFYTVVYLQQREMNKGVQVLKRISKPGLKAKPS